MSNVIVPSANLVGNTSNVTPVGIVGLLSKSLYEPEVATVAKSAELALGETKLSTSVLVYVVACGAFDKIAKFWVFSISSTCVLV